MIQEFGKQILSQIAKEGIGEKVLNKTKGVPIFTNSEVSSVERLRKAKGFDERVPKFERSEIESKNEKDSNVRKDLRNEVSPYSENINKYIRSDEELDFYQKQGLEERTVGDKKALISNEIDPDKIDAMGRNNKNRMKGGLAPLDKNGDSFNLHHIGQKSDSPLAELPAKGHHENYSMLHGSSKPTEVHGKDSTWDTQRANYWKARAKDF